MNSVSSGLGARRSEMLLPSKASHEPRPVSDILSEPFPVLASTHLCLELLLERRSCELQSISALLSRDPGAVLRLFTRIAEEFPEPGTRPERLEDCVASLQTEDLRAVLYIPASLRSEQKRLIPFAQHGFTIARFARAVASSLGLFQELAFQVGLLHAIGTLPAALGRTIQDHASEDAGETTLAVARRYHLPPPLREALLAVHRRESRSVWAATMYAAHDLAAEHPDA